MIDAGTEYFSDPAAIFNGMLAILKDATCDSIKIAVVTPITKSLMNKYLAAYPADHLENLGVVGGNDGISYWGSSILLDMQSVEVCAYYKMKIELPFLDLFEYQLKTISSTRAWIGDGTHNDAKSAAGETSKTGGSSKTGRGVGLDEQATGLPGFGYNGNLGIFHKQKHNGQKNKYLIEAQIELMLYNKMSLNCQDQMLRKYQIFKN